MANVQISEVLAWVNEQRALQGREPLDDLPKGYRGRAQQCPVANALNSEFQAIVGGFTAQFEVLEHGPIRRLLRLKPTRRVVQWVLPVAVSKFVRLFDRGDLPQYDVLAKD